MSERTPFITSYIYPAHRAALPILADVLARWAIDVRVIDIPPTGAYAISGLYQASWPGALAAEGWPELEAALRTAGVAFSFALAFAGGTANDQRVYVYTPLPT